ncbi:MAG: SRPBCC family protein [Bdellovibrionia bacterium]
MMKKILLVLGVLVAIVLIVPTFLPSKFFMSRSVEINAPVTSVFSKLTDLNEYVKWNPFPEGDPTSQANVTGTGVGSYLEWKGEKTGEGKMTITDIMPQQKISIKMDFFKPMAGEGVVTWITMEKPEAKTEMVWTFEQTLPYFSRYFGLVMDKMMGKHFEKGLSNYNTLVEASK